jgi:hypothetical protein
VPAVPRQVLGKAQTSVLPTVPCPPHRQGVPPPGFLPERNAPRFPRHILAGEYPKSKETSSFPNFRRLDRSIHELMMVVLFVKGCKSVRKHQRPRRSTGRLDCNPKKTDSPVWRGTASGRTSCNIRFPLAKARRHSLRQSQVAKLVLAACRYLKAARRMSIAPRLSCCTWGSRRRRFAAAL